MQTDTWTEKPEAQPEEDEQDDRMVSCHITEPDGTSYNASIHLDPKEPLSNVSAALLSAAMGVTAAYSQVLHALFRDLIETQRALANALPVEASALRPGIRVADVDMMIAYHRNTDHSPRLVIPGLEDPVDAEVVRAILAAAGAF